MNSFDSHVVIMLIHNNPTREPFFLVRIANSCLYFLSKPQKKLAPKGYQPAPILVVISAFTVDGRLVRSGSYLSLETGHVNYHAFIFIFILGTTMTTKK